MSSRAFYKTSHQNQEFRKGLCCKRRVTSRNGCRHFRLSVNAGLTQLLNQQHRVKP